MRSSRLGISAALAAGGLAMAGLALAPAASATTPTDATAVYDCGAFGGGEASLHADQSGGNVTLTLTTAITSPLAIGAGQVSSSLTMSLNSSGTAVFTGSSNPAIPAGGAFNSGPLTGPTAFTAGDSLDSYLGGTAFTMVVFGTTVSCDATSAQVPGAFVVD
ncbi:hypothetical protein [Streptomyces sp. NPDC050738]|uniref:hypothetical protein n=1 Tax=Streptomyces sp. NPDC050738 TaxID=3154744 RepID=UPI00343CBBEB